MVRSGGVCGAVTAIVLFAAACERTPGPDVQQPEPALRGANLVVGTSVDQWSLLSVPRDGGLAEARDLSDLQRVVWTGTTELPPSADVHALPGGRVVLRTAEGIVHTYDPLSDALVRVGEVAPEAAWLGDGSVGLYLAPGGELLEISRDGSWTYGLDREVSWAAPTEGGVLVVLDDEGDRRTLWLLHRDEDQPAETGAAQVQLPGVMTAWGRRAVLTSTTGRGLVVLTVAPIEQAGDLDVGGTIVALVASPSTHEVYVALDGPPRLIAVNRFNLTSRVLAELPGPATSVRPSLFGDGILAAQAGRVSWIPVSGGSAVDLGATWRADLPVGLPGGRVIAATEERVVVVDVRTGSETDLEGADVSRWWLPVHWNPASAIVTTDRLAGQPVITDAPTGDVPEADIDSAMMAERLAAAPGLRDEAAASTAPGSPPGFYAIVGSARQAEGIRALVQSLEDAGFATQVQSFPDEAGRTWYRGLVGPYRSRSEAEAAARQLLRERRLEAWVTEIGATGRPEEESI
jgi:cell division septation protein DedD